MTEVMDGPGGPLTVEEPVADLTAPDEWLDALLPQKLDQATDRCDMCQGQALHAWQVNGVIILMCNHHGRENRVRLLPYAHRDYRIPVEEAEAINAKNRADAIEAEAKPVPTGAGIAPDKRVGVAENAGYREYPRHLTRWDLEWWGQA